MAYPKPEYPTIEKTPNNPLHDHVERHPAYGQIGASRVTGASYLYGSDFEHRNYIVIRIGKSESLRGLSNDHYYAPLNERIVEVALSEAQWATFVSSLNVGQGVPCTIQAINNRHVPGIAEPIVKREQFKMEVNDRLQQAVKALKDLRVAIADAPLSGKKKDELGWLVTAAEREMGPNIEFVGNQFGEYVETLMERAKIEAEAHLHATITAAGLEALRSGRALNHGEESHADIRRSDSAGAGVDGGDDRAVLPSAPAGPVE